MNTDIRISVSFRGHRKRRKLKMLIGPEATDHLIDLWISAAMNHPEGILHGLDETDIALEAGWNGDPGEFVNGLVAAGFLEKNNGNYRLHDWENHQPYVVHAPERARRAKHAAKMRWERRDACLTDTESIPETCSEHAGSMPDAMPKHESSNAPSPAPSPSPTPLVTDISAVLFEFYTQEINPVQISKKRALSNIAKRLKKHSAEDLQAAIRNYKTISSKREKTYRHDPANFFGTQNKVFEDYLPENFQKSEPASKGQPQNPCKAEWF